MKKIILLLSLSILLFPFQKNIIVYSEYKDNSSIHLKSFESNSITEWGVEKEKIKEKMKEFLGESPNTKVSLNSRIISIQDKGDYKRYKVAYNVEKDEVVSAYLLVPKNIQGPSPAILALHQTTKDGKKEVVGLTGNKEMSYGLDLVKEGFIVLVPDALSAGERIFEGYQEYESKPFYDENPSWSMIGKAIWDNQRALDYLMSLDFVDKNNVMVMGHSEGAIDSLFLAAYDERVSAVALNCGLTTISGDPDPYKWSRDSWFIAFPTLKDYLIQGEIPFDFHEIVALVAPRPFLSFSASKDVSFPQYQGVFEIEKRVTNVYSLYNKESNLNTFVFSGGHSFTENNKMFMYQWLKSQIK